MGLNDLARGAGIAALGLVLITAGCEHTSAPMQLSVIGDDINLSGNPARPLEQKESPYVNADWHDDDAPSNLISTTLTITGSMVAAVVNPISDLSARGFQMLSGDTRGKAVRLLYDDASADNRRMGLNKLVNFGFLNTSSAFVKKCRDIAEQDPDFTVRATAIRTENIARDSKATPIFIKGLTDANEWIRLESAKALVNIPDVNAASPLIVVMNDHAESRDVRTAATDALKHYHTLTVARALSSMLNDKNFTVCWQARKSLRYLTTKDFGYSEAAWLSYFAGPEKPFG